MYIFYNWDNKVINKANDYNWEAIIKDKYLDQCIDKEIDVEFCDASQHLVGGISTVLKKYKIEELDLAFYQDRYRLRINDDLLLVYSEIKLSSMGIIQLIKNNGALSYISLSDGKDIKNNTYDKEIINNIIAFTDNFECIDCPIYNEEESNCEECPFIEVTDILKKL